MVVVVVMVIVVEVMVTVVVVMVIVMVVIVSVGVIVKGKVRECYALDLKNVFKSHVLCWQPEALRGW